MVVWWGGGEGVYATTVDERQHRVTVTGDVDGETLIRKLHRHGKRAELLPLKPPQQKEKEKEKEKDKGKEKGKEEKEKETGKEKGKEEEEETKKMGEDSEKKVGGAGKPACESAAISPPAAAANTAKDEGSPNGREPPKAEQKDGDGGTGKKGENKSQKEGDDHVNKEDTKRKKKGGSADAGATCAPPPRDLHHRPYPSPVYAASYNTAHPTSSYSGAFYPGPPVLLPHYFLISSGEQQHHFPAFHLYPPPGEPIPPPDDYPYDVFNDENANSCRVM